MSQAPWKVWHPLSIWKVLGIFFLAEVVCVIPTLVLREGLGIPVPMWIAFALAGGLGAVASGLLANRARSERPPER